MRKRVGSRGRSSRAWGRLERHPVALAESALLRAPIVRCFVRTKGLIITTNITFEHTEPSQMQTGTHLQGQFRAAYDELVEAFGEPTYMAERDGGFVKVWTRWNTAIPCAY